MMNSILFAAALLLSGHSMPKTQTTVEPQVVSAPVALQAFKMSAAVEKALIEKYTAPHWNLSIAQAWDYYTDGLIVITEIEVDRQYRIAYNGGILDVLVDPSDI